MRSNLIRIQRRNRKNRLVFVKFSFFVEYICSRVLKLFYLISRQFGKNGLAFVFFFFFHFFHTGLDCVTTVRSRSVHRLGKMTTYLLGFCILDRKKSIW